jgi:predicted nucleotidyltransferase
VLASRTGRSGKGLTEMSQARDNSSMLPAHVPFDQNAISRFCERWGIVELSLFGSVLRDDFRPDSDVDVLVDFTLDAHPTLFDLVEMQDELEALFGRKVDLLTRGGVESSRNAERKAAIISSAQPIYVA